MKNFLLLKDEILNNKYRFFLLFTTKVIDNFIPIAIPYLIGNFLDNLIKYNNINIVYEFTKNLFLVTTLGVLIGYVEQILYSKLSISFNFSLNKLLINKVNKSSYLEINKYDSSYLSQRIIDDCNNVVTFTLNNFVDIIVNLISFLFVCVSLFSINYKISLCLICLLPLNYIIYIMFKNRLYSKNLDLVESKNKYFSVINENIKNIYFIKANSLYSKFIKRIEKSFHNLRISTINGTRVFALFDVFQQLSSSFALIILFILGGAGIIKGSLSIGEFIIINSYFNILTGIVSYFSSLSSSYQNYKVSYNRLIDLLNMSTENSGHIKIDNSIESITINDLKFVIDEEIIINNLSYEFKKGNIYSVCGENGAGKSTLINIITNIYQNFEGSVLVNNIDIKDLDSVNYRSNNICFVEQNPVILNSSFYENTTIKSEDIDLSNKNLDNSLMKLYESLFNKYNDIKMEISNNSLSGGEMQKLSLVRSFFKKADVYILDEPTNALDKLSIEYLKRYLAILKKNSIIIIITHTNDFEDLINYKLKISKYVEGMY